MKPFAKRELPAPTLALVLSVLGLLFTATLARALEVPTIFSNDMVLQQEQEIPVWGRAEPGRSITVQLGDETVAAQAQADGTWEARLQPRQASFDPLTLTIEDGTQKLTFSNVLVGEVWLCSGQSNMVWPIKDCLDADIEPLIANPAAIRLYQVEVHGSTEPRFTAKARWTPATAENVATFSAVGWHFGRDLQSVLGVPIGLINSSRNASPSIAWTRSSAFSKLPLLEENVREWEEGMATFPERQAAWRKAHADYRLKHNLPPDAQLDPREHPDAPARHPPLYDPTSHHRPGSLANGMMAPVAPFAIRGVIWYQGESDREEPHRYDDRLRVMVEDWRVWWKNPELAFGVVQLASHKPITDQPSDSSWAQVRESQRRFVKADPHAGLVVTIDVGEADDIHPPNKQVVGRRLARWALTDIYSLASLRGGPEPISATFDSAVTITFSQTGRGLRALHGAPLQEFTLAGADGVFHHALAKIEAPDRVVVSAPEVPSPVHVRYGWRDNPSRANLVNQERLPATPFEFRAPATH